MSFFLHKNNIFIFFFNYNIGRQDVNILLVFASEKEAALLDLISGISKAQGVFTFAGHRLDVCITGVGGINTAWAMHEWLICHPVPDLAINAGIAGSFRSAIQVGEPVLPVSDCFADLGVEINGEFFTLNEAGIGSRDNSQPEGERLKVGNEHFDKISRLARQVHAVSVNTASGSEASVKRLKNKFNPDIESMEGATFFYICIREKIPFFAVRSVSNYVETGERGSWDIPLALRGLAGKLEQILNTI